MEGEPKLIQELIDTGVGSLSNNTFDLDLTTLVGSTEFDGMGFIYAIIDKSFSGEGSIEVITEFIKDCTITYYETIIYFPTLSVGEHELEVELLQQQYMPIFNNKLLISLDMNHINGEYVNIDSMCNKSYKLQKVYLSHNLKNIGNYAFYSCSDLTSITIPDSVRSIGDSAFSSCSGLTSVTIPSSVTSIGNFAFSSCNSLASITIPDSVTSIGSQVFYNCSGLTSVTIPDSVTSIGDYTFSYCYNLTSVTILDGVTSIGKKAFQNCRSLTSVTCLATTAPTLNNSVFYNLSTNGTLYVPNGSDYSSWLSNLPSGWTIEYI